MKAWERCSLRRGRLFTGEGEVFSGVEGVMEQWCADSIVVLVLTLVRRLETMG